MSRKYTLSQIIEKAKNIHGDKYDYSLVEYTNMHKKVMIKCSKHGIFYQSMTEHINKSKGCKHCAIELKKDTRKTFTKKAKKIHRDKYDYSLVNYINSKTKVKIICSKHGVFEQRPTDHINNLQGCPICKTSKGENEIIYYLEKNKISYIREKRFNDCRDKYTLPFDFYLSEYNLCIEYDGIQHYKPIKYFGGDKKFKLIKNHDKIKTKFCKEKFIDLERINYDEKIEFKIKQILNKYI